MSRFLEGISLNFWILSTTPIFLTAFLLLIFWVFRRGSKTYYEHVGRIPLEGEKTHDAQ